MRAAEYDGVDEGVLVEEFLERIPDEIVGTGFVILATFHQWHPHGAGLAHDGAGGIEFLYLQVVGLRIDGALGGKHTDVASA